MAMGAALRSVFRKRPVIAPQKWAIVETYTPTALARLSVGELVLSVAPFQSALSFTNCQTQSWLYKVLPPMEEPTDRLRFVLDHEGAAKLTRRRSTPEHYYSEPGILRFEGNRRRKNWVWSPLTPCCGGGASGVDPAWAACDRCLEPVSVACRFHMEDQLSSLISSLLPPRSTNALTHELEAVELADAVFTFLESFKLS